MQRPARALRLPLGVERAGDGQRLGVDLQHRAQHRTAAVERRDARQVSLDQPARGQPAGGHPRLQLGDGGLGQLEAVRRRGRGARGGIAAGVGLGGRRGRRGAARGLGRQRFAGQQRCRHRQRGAAEQAPAQERAAAGRPIDSRLFIHGWTSRATL